MKPGMIDDRRMLLHLALWAVVGAATWVGILWAIGVIR